MCSPHSEFRNRIETEVYSLVPNLQHTDRLGITTYKNKDKNQL